MIKIPNSFSNPYNFVRKFRYIYCTYICIYFTISIPALCNMLTVCRSCEKIGCIKIIFMKNLQTCDINPLKIHQHFTEMKHFAIIKNFILFFIPLKYMYSKTVNYTNSKNKDDCLNITVKKLVSEIKKARERERTRERDKMKYNESVFHLKIDEVQKGGG